MKKTETEDMPEPKRVERSVKRPSKSKRMGAATLFSQANIQESTNSSIHSTKNKISTIYS